MKRRGFLMALAGLVGAARACAKPDVRRVPNVEPETPNVEPETPKMVATRAIRPGDFIYAKDGTIIGVALSAYEPLMEIQRLGTTSTTTRGYLYQ